MVILTACILRETYRPLLLEKKVKEMRKRTGNVDIKSALGHSKSTSQYLRLSLVRPLKLLFFSPVVLLPALGLALIFGEYFLLISTMGTVFQERYAFSVGESGLAYLGTGIGLILALFIFAGTSDRTYKTLAQHGTPKPEIRLAPISLGAPLACVGLLIYGWGIEKNVHWMVPIVGAGLFGTSLVAFLMPVGTYLIEVFGNYSASATGALAILRSITGGLLPLCAGQLYRTLGYGWGNTLLAFISLVFAPLPWLFYKNGERLRQKYVVSL
jgi:hypothetical protein